MEMQDNEFDELFRSKLEDIEATPSAKVWPGIAAELNAGKRKNTLLLFLSIAASIIVLVTAGILFIPQKRGLTVKPDPKNNTAKVSRTIISLPAIKSSSNPVTAETPPVKLDETDVTANKHTPARYLKLSKDIQGPQAAENSVSGKPGDPSALASAVQKQPEPIKAVVPDEKIQLAANQAPAETSQPALPAITLQEDKQPEAVQVKPAHKMRSFGDLLNAAVAKVDKRRDKFIEFTNDDDETTVTGINLGIIKIKKGE
ncbi:MAG: hypothetical protein ACHQIM_05130 [Sphingobacteriales bacterium]